MMTKAEYHEFMFAHLAYGEGFMRPLIEVAVACAFLPDALVSVMIEQMERNQRSQMPGV